MGQPGQPELLGAAGETTAKNRDISQISERELKMSLELHGIRMDLYFMCAMTIIGAAMILRTVTCSPCSSSFSITAVALLLAGNIILAVTVGNFTRIVRQIRNTRQLVRFNHVTRRDITVVQETWLAKGASADFWKWFPTVLVMVLSGGTVVTSTVSIDLRELVGWQCAFHTGAIGATRILRAWRCRDKVISERELVGPSCADRLFRRHRCLCFLCRPCKFMCKLC